MHVSKHERQINTVCYKSYRRTLYFLISIFNEKNRIRLSEMNTSLKNMNNIVPKQKKSINSLLSVYNKTWNACDSVREMFITVCGLHTKKWVGPGCGFGNVPSLTLRSVLLTVLSGWKFRCVPPFVSVAHTRFHLACKCVVMVGFNCACEITSSKANWKGTDLCVAGPEYEHANCVLEHLIIELFVDLW